MHYLLGNSDTGSNKSNSERFGGPALRVTVSFALIPAHRLPAVVGKPLFNLLLALSTGIQCDRGQAVRLNPFPTGC